MIKKVGVMYDIIIEVGNEILEWGINGLIGAKIEFMKRIAVERVAYEHRVALRA